MSSVKRQKGLTTSHLHAQLDPFSSKLTMYSFHCLILFIMSSYSQVQATDSDEGSNADVMYNMAFTSHSGQQNFGVHAESGEIYVKDSEFEAISYNLAVMAKDSPENEKLAR